MPSGEPRYAPWHLRMSAWFIDALVVVALLGLATYIDWNLLYDPMRTEGFAMDFAEDLEILIYGEPIENIKPRGTSVNGAVPIYPQDVTRWLYALMVATVIILSVVNTVVVQGRTGRSLGKLVTGLRVVDPRTHRPVGIGRSFLRQLAHTVDALPCYFEFLWPLFDTRRRTFADMLGNTIVVRGREPSAEQTGQRSPRDLAPWFITGACTVAAYTLISIVAWLNRWGL
ncbi:RDD family protein [Nocardia barduliensis]|uniref:RDD family protein n=1 Tax=Nocardia barduliensis TaxID=2736643 RepID=UPI001573AF70|nr:RDD family protein [Nocardia barduliensis]